MHNMCILITLPSLLIGHRSILAAWCIAFYWTLKTSCFFNTNVMQRYVALESPFKEIKKLHYQVMYNALLNGHLILESTCQTAEHDGFYPFKMFIALTIWKYESLTTKSTCRWTYIYLFLGKPPQSGRQLSVKYVCQFSFHLFIRPIYNVYHLSKAYFI